LQVRYSPDGLAKDNRLALLSLLYQKEPSKALESSLKRHTALIKRIRQSIGLDNRDQILKDIETLTLEKYIDEIAGAVPEGIVRCKLEKDVWSATEVRYLGGHRGTRDS
jgi:regulator of nonsense transcripts 2